ncbi:MAG: aldo/keto reductase [Deferrisomatales bacterium]|nr:aldo/keto reductase [Deferrisomatales bacterium]
MEQRSFGGTDLRVSPIGLGCWGISGDWGPVNRDEAVGTLQRAFELGVNFFDTADMYGKGRSEELIREALGPHRAEIIIASKGGFNFYEGERHLDFRPEYLEFALGESLRRLGTEYLDLYQLHNPRPADLTDEVFALLDRLRAQGKIRHYGVSLNSRLEGADRVRERCPASVQVIYNLLDQRAAAEVLPWARSRGVAAIARVPLASGLLTGKYRRDPLFSDGDQRRKHGPEWLARGVEGVDPLRFLARPGRSLAQAALGLVLTHPAVTVTIPGARSAAQVEANVAALSAVPLDREELERVWR